MPTVRRQNYFNLFLTFALFSIANAAIARATPCSELLQGFLSPISNKKIFINRMQVMGFAAIDIAPIESSSIDALIAEAGDRRDSFKITIRDEFQQRLGREFVPGVYSPWAGIFGTKKLAPETLKPFEDYIERIEAYLNSFLAPSDGVLRYSADQAMIAIEGPEAAPVMKREFHTHPTSEVDVLNSILGPTTRVRHNGLTTTALPNTLLVISGEARAKRLVEFGVQATDHASPLPGTRSSWRVFFFCSFKAHLASTR